MGFSRLGNVSCPELFAGMAICVVLDKLSASSKRVQAKQSKTSMTAKSEVPVLNHDGRNGDVFKSCNSYGDVSL